MTDWESAGRGAAILDLADFLFRSQCDAYGAPPDTLRPSHVEVAVSGYASHRLPGDDELDLLALATRFIRICGQTYNLLQVEVPIEANAKFYLGPRIRISSVWRAAWMLTQVRAEGWTPRLEQRLARVQAPYELAEPTASLARSAFQRYRLSVS